VEQIQTNISRETKRRCAGARHEEYTAFQYHDEKVLRMLMPCPKQVVLTLDSFFGDQEGNFSLNIKCIKAASFSEEA
jgi:hypothetical protein